MVRKMVALLFFCVKILKKLIIISSSMSSVDFRIFTLISFPSKYGFVKEKEKKKRIIIEKLKIKEQLRN